MGETQCQNHRITLKQKILWAHTNYSLPNTVKNKIKKYNEHMKIKMVFNSKTLHNLQRIHGLIKNLYQPLFSLPYNRHTYYPIVGKANVCNISQNFKELIN